MRSDCPAAEKPVALNATEPRDLTAAHRFFAAAITAHGTPDEVVTDLAQALETAIEEVAPRAFHNTEQ